MRLRRALQMIKFNRGLNMQTNIERHIKKAAMNTAKTANCVYIKTTEQSTINESKTEI